MMIATWRWGILGGGLWLFLAGLGSFGGIAAVTFAERGTELLSPYEGAAQTWQSSPMRLEGAPAGREAGDRPWTPHLQKVDEGLAKKDTRAAEVAWHEAYVAALGSRRWEGMVEIGDAYLRIGEVAGARPAAKPTARQAYLVALFRARNQDSLDGVLRAAEAFAALGDREMVEQGVSIAQRLVADARDAQAHERVRAVAERVATGLLAAAGP
jgi:hypothetical protein